MAIFATTKRGADMAIVYLVETRLLMRPIDFCKTVKKTCIDDWGFAGAAAAGSCCAPQPTTQPTRTKDRPGVAINRTEAKT